MAPAETGKQLVHGPRMVLEQRGTQGYSAGRAQASPNQGLTPNLQPDYPQKMQGINAHVDVGQMDEPHVKRRGNCRVRPPKGARACRFDAVDRCDAPAPAGRSRGGRERVSIPPGVLAAGDTRLRKTLPRQGQCPNKSMRRNAPRANIPAAPKDTPSCAGRRDPEFSRRSDGLADEAHAARNAGARRRRHRLTRPEDPP